MSRVPDILANGRSAHVAAVSAAGVCEAVAIGFAAFAMRDVFSALHSGTPLPASALAILMMSGLIVAGLRIASRAVAEKLGQNYAIVLRKKLYRHLAGMSRSEVAEKRAGALGLRFVGDLSTARGWASLGLTRIISACFVLPGAALTLWLLNPSMAAATVIPVAAALLTMISVAVVVEPMHRRLRSKRANIAISMMERVSMAPELDLMRRTRRELKALDRHGDRLNVIAVARVKAVAALRAVPEVGIALAGIAILWTASRNGAPAAEAAAALAVLGILSTPLRDLAGVWDRLCAWRIAREKYENVLAIPSSRRRPDKKKEATAIEFCEVRCRGLFFETSIAPGEIVLVTGETGAGKSTFLSLAAGLERPTAGAVRYGKREEMPRTVFVDSAAPILQGSVRRALTLGALSRADDEAIETAARLFGFGPVIDRLGGLSARIGEGGRSLSEGERLRLHMTRAYLTEPNLLIVDAPNFVCDKSLISDLKTLIAKGRATVLIGSVSAVPFGFAGRHMHIEAGNIEEREIERDIKLRYANLNGVS